ncbi:hypothetical protein C8J57DRAFT_1724297 [Mycena rebaudengoi]|nr:hypothetical protein C8J57DRAFT_1724297 [Mycena rebaudengoi]
MYAKSVIVSLALLSVASPAFSAPLPAASNTELEARAIPAGALGLLKSLGSGILSGGAISGLLALLGGGGDDAAAARRSVDDLTDEEMITLLEWLGEKSTGAVATRDVHESLEARGIAQILEKLIGTGGASIGTVIKNAILGGVAGGVGKEAVESAAGTERRAVPAAAVGGAVKQGIKSILGNGLANGIGSALGGLGIGAIFSKLFGGDDAAAAKRAVEDLTPEEINTLLEWVNEQSLAGPEARALGASVGKGIAGLVASLGASAGAEALIEKLKELFRRELETSLNDLD